MSVARGFPNAGHFYSNIVKPIAISCQFTVTPTNGLGITSLKSNGFIRNVFMHTSTTPTSNNGATNPNPAVGYAVVQFNQNFNKYIGGFFEVAASNTGSIKIDNSALTAGAAYVITTLGNATAVKWLAIGVPAGVTPAVGVSFIALTDGGSGNTLTSRVSTPVPSGIVAVELVGAPNTMSNTASLGVNGGAYVLVQFLGATNSSTTTLIPTAPVTASVVDMTFLLDGSSVTVDGL